ncbi:MAG: hypothetical protein DMG05_16725 [Acidobacteria bacterium]|nr:MAG: hypothetical protein DMG05_16725 [Acidobacteriota bacterium]
MSGHPFLNNQSHPGMVPWRTGFLRWWCRAFPILSHRARRVLRLVLEIKSRTRRQFQKREQNSRNVAHNGLDGVLLGFKGHLISLNYQ